MLLRKVQDPLAAISKETRLTEKSLFLHLEELARKRPIPLDCTVQQLTDDEFVAVLSDHDSGAEVRAWSGAADGVVVEFETWLDKKSRVRHMPLLRLSVVPNISRAVRTIQQCGKASDLAGHCMSERNEAQSFGAFPAF